MANHECRLCGGETRLSFRTEMLGRHDIGYFRCTGCESLQSEMPFWLNEAYSKGESRCSFDTGGVSRSRLTCAAILSIYKLGGFKGPALDFGGGTGLLCRMLRDALIDAYSFDEYGDGGYAKGYHGSLADRAYDLISAIEVLEHLPTPRSTLDSLFGAGAPVVVATTMLYNGQGPGWDYLSLFTGQHVFFYSAKGLDWICERHGYKRQQSGDFHIFYKSSLDKSVQRRLQWVRPTVIKLFDYGIPILSRWGAYIDGEEMRRRFPKGIV